MGMPLPVCLISFKWQMKQSRSMWQSSYAWQQLAPCHLALNAFLVPHAMADQISVFYPVPWLKVFLGTQRPVSSVSHFTFPEEESNAWCACTHRHNRPRAAAMGKDWGVTSKAWSGILQLYLVIPSVCIRRDNEPYLPIHSLYCNIAFTCPVEHNLSYTMLRSKAAHRNAAGVSVSFHQLQKEPLWLSQRRNINPGAVCHTRSVTSLCNTQGDSDWQRPSYVPYLSPLFNTGIPLSQEPWPREHPSLETSVVIPWQDAGNRWERHSLLKFEGKFALLEHPVWLRSQLWPWRRI